MNKELFVSSTPHETKVGLVEDDLLAEIYLERENEYTLAGSIYKGRVTRVLPGMQSAFVDIGLERDAFLYVSDFMELEEHDEDLTDVVPANRGVQDMRAQPARPEAAAGELQSPAESQGSESETGFGNGSGRSFDANQEQPELQSSEATAAGPESSIGGNSQDRERGGYRGRRRRRGGRRDGRGDGRDRGSEPRLARPAIETASPIPVAPRVQESGRSQQFRPPAGYQPILLPGESISKYRGLAPTQAIQEPHPQEGALETASTSAPQPGAAVADTFPDDEPIFSQSASGSPASVTETPREQGDHSWHSQRDHAIAAPASEASTSTEWNREFGRPQPVSAAPSIGDREPAKAEQEFVEEEEELVTPQFEHSTQPLLPAREAEIPAFAAPGTLEEETIDEEEADAVRYEESSDDGYDEFEEETRAAGQQGSEAGQQRELSDVRETVAEIHMSSFADASAAPAAGAPEVEEDTEELELEEAQAEAEALLDAEAGGTGAVDARAEVRAPAGTVGYTQRAPRPRPGFD
ncbi:MAG: hypothetical protein WB660_09905, partial [Candidatus Sulfotelmatobacter sp.]